MKAKRKQFNHYAMLRAVSVIIAIAVNVLLRFISFKLSLPIRLDILGTITVTLLAGLVPGLITPIASGLISSLFFDNTAVFFMLPVVFIVLSTCYFEKKHGFDKLKVFLAYSGITALISGGTAGLIQILIYGGPSSPNSIRLLQSASDATHLPKTVLIFIAQIFIYLVEIAALLGVALLILRFIPAEARSGIKHSLWLQKPLSDRELEEMNDLSLGVRFSLRRRVTGTIVGLVLILILITSWVGIGLYYTNMKEERKQSAENAARFAADVIDPDLMDDYVAYGSKVPGYAETEKMLYNIRNNAIGVKYLYAVQMREDGCYVAFDLETEDTEAYNPGDKIEFEEAFIPYLPKLFAGEEIEPIESNALSGWVLTVYQPIRDSDGICRGYVGADVSLGTMTGYMGTFLIRMAVILSAFLIALIIYATWIINYFMVYPINSMAACLEKISDSGFDEKQLADNARSLKALDIHTDNEVEKLYNALNNMTIRQSEQIHDLKNLSDSTARMQDGLIITMADMVESRDSDTGAHVQKTAAYVKIIVEGLEKKGYYSEKITPKFKSDVVRSAPLHDVGKINIPDNILNKPGKLTEEEFEIMKTHTTAGKKILENAISSVQGESYLREARNMAAYHHERWDGKGYPEGIHGEVIPLAARIMAVADVFDALSSPRVYKPAFPLEKALSIIQEGSGTQFDPKCVEVFMDALPEVKVILKKYNGSV